MKIPMLSPCLLIASLLWAGCSPAVRAEPLADPAPPTVAAAPEGRTPAEPQSFDRLTYRAAPKPLPEGAVTEPWPRFLGPHDDATSGETKLLAKFPAGGPKIVWEMKKGTGYTSPAIVDGRLMELMAPLGSDADVVPVTAAHTIGMRVYRRTLVGLLDFYRRGLAQRLLADTNGGSTSAARVPSPFLATFPRAVQCPDLCDVLRVAWAERLKNLAKDIKVTNVSYLI